MVPSHAVKLWIEGHDLALEIPGTKELSHIVRYPATERGISLMISMLRQRTRKVGPITTKSAPINYQIEKDLKPTVIARKSKATPAQRAQARDILRKLGMI